MRLIPFLFALSALLASCAHRPPAPIESRPVQQAETPAQASSRESTRPSKAQAAKSPSTMPEQPVPAGMHRVKRGETLIGISLEYGVTWRDLVLWNQIGDPNRIEVGQLLIVRAPAPSPAPSPAPVAPVATAPEGMTPPSRIGVRPLAPKPGPEPSFPRLSGPDAPAPSTVTPAPAPVAPVPAAPAAAPAAAATPPVAAPDVPPIATPAAPPAAPEVTADDLSWAWPANGGVITQFAEGGSKGIAIAGAPGEAIFAAERGRVVYSGNGLRGYGNLVIVKHSSDFITAYAHNRAVLVKEGQTVRRGQKIAELGMSDADRPMLHFELRKGGKPVDPLGFLPSR